MLFTYTQVNVAGSSRSILAIGVDVGHDIVLWGSISRDLCHMPEG